MKTIEIKINDDTAANIERLRTRLEMTLSEVLIISLALLDMTISESDAALQEVKKAGKLREIID